MHVPFNDAAGVPHCLIELHASQTDYLQQIVEMDPERKVHRFGSESVEQLIQYRIGGPGFVKTAFAAVNHGTNRVSSVIFGHLTNKPITSGVDLQGDVASILREKSTTPFTGKPTAAVFYEISAVPGSNTGALLILTILQNTDGFERATLSPLRSMQQTYPGMESAKLASEEKMVLSYLHLLDRKNRVQRFHMGNGAIVRDIKLKANAPDTEDGIDGMGIMINYGYTGDLATLETNRAVLSTINSGAEPCETLLQLMEKPLAERLFSLVSLGAMKSLHTPALADNMKRVMDKVMNPAPAAPAVA